MGVRIFFVISGFLITSLLLKEQHKTGGISLRKFYIRRALRIFPVFYLYLVVMLLVNQIMHLEINPWCFAGALYLSNFSFFPTSWFTAHSWSLSVEEQYYLLWPVILRKLKGKAILAAGLVVLASVFLRVLVYLRPQYTDVTLSPFFLNADAILIGSLYALLLFKNAIPLGWFKNHRMSLSLISLLAVWFIYNARQNQRFGLALLPFGPALAAALIGLVIIINMEPADNVLYKILNQRAVVTMGKLSYSLYVWQQFFLVPGYDFVSKIYWNVFPVNLLLAVVASALSYFFFEKYFFKIKDRFRNV